MPISPSILIALNALTNTGANVVSGLNQKRILDQQKQEKADIHAKIAQLHRDHNGVIDSHTISDGYARGIPVEALEPLTAIARMTEQEKENKVRDDLRREAQVDKAKAERERELDKDVTIAKGTMQQDMYGQGRRPNPDLTPEEFTGIQQGVQKKGEYTGTVTRKKTQVGAIPTGIFGGVSGVPDVKTSEEKIFSGADVPQQPKDERSDLDASGVYHVLRRNANNELENVAVRPAGGTGVFTKPTTARRTGGGGTKGSKPLTAAQQNAENMRAAQDAAIAQRGIIKSADGLHTNEDEYIKAKARHEARQRQATSPQGAPNDKAAAEYIRKAMKANGAQ